MRPLVASELDKLRSSGMLARLVAVSVAAVIAVVGLSVSQGIGEPDSVAPNAANYEVRTDEETAPDDRQTEVREALTRWTVLGLVALLVGIFSLGGEFQTGTATATFLASPRRTRVLVAKCLAGLSVFVPLGFTAAAINSGMVLAWLDGPLGFSTPEVLFLAAGGVLMVALSFVAGLGLGAIVRRPARATVLALVIVAVVEPALIPATSDWGGASYLPTSALAGIIQAPSGTGFAAHDLLPPGAGAALAVSYAGLLAAGGALAIERVDVG